MQFSRVTFVAVMSMALCACGKSFDGPDEGDLGDFLEMELDEGIEAEDIEIIAAQNVGDEIEPIYRTRANLDLVLEEDFVERVDEIGDRPVVKVVAEEGTEYPAVLFTRSEPIGEDWTVRIEKLQVRNRKGRPLSSFSDYLIEGSDEEKQALEAQKREDAEAEKQAAERLAAARRGFAAKWTASQPLKRRGSVYSRRGQQIGVSFDLKPGEDGFGRGTGRVYDFADPSVFAQSDVTYTVDDSGDFATVTFLARAQHDELGFYVTEGTNFKLTDDGKADIGNGRWSIAMKK